jgi:hypothetical protein
MSSRSIVGKDRRFESVGICGGVRIDDGSDGMDASEDETRKRRSVVAILALIMLAFS